MNFLIRFSYENLIYRNNDENAREKGLSKAIKEWRKRLKT